MNRGTDTMHVTRNGDEMRVADMTDEHLERTIALIRRRAEEGVEVVTGTAWPEPSGDVETLYGERAKVFLGLPKYVLERNRRWIQRRAGAQAKGGRS